MEDPEARKNRLKALREKANKPAADAPIKFRNYRPTDNTLLGGSAEGSADKEAAPPTAPPRKREEEEDVIKRELKKHMEEHGGGEQDVLNIAPKKPNWDLKRDVAKKVERLDRLTQRAIVDMLREKIANQEDEESSSGEDEE